MSEELVWHLFFKENEGPIKLLVTKTEKADYNAASVFYCDHDETEYRDRKNKGGSVERRRQCLTCGKAVGNAIKLDRQEDALAWDDELMARAESEMVERRERIFEIALERTTNLENDGYAFYEDYLSSKKWARKRRAVLDRDSELCQACLSREATEVHHLTYDRIFEEPMFDLVAICRPCHERLHRKMIAAVASAKAKSADIPDMPS